MSSIKKKGTKEELKFWCDKYGLTCEEYKCEKCSGTYKMDVMYSKNKTYYGLESSPCEKCGFHKIKKQYISFNKKANDNVRKLMGYAK